MNSSKCANCSATFEIRPQDEAYYRRIDVPWPTWCPRCRHMRRHGFVNDYIFFTRSCDCCQKRFVSIFPPESEYRVFCQTCWYAEDRNDKAEGRDFDFSRPFFEQFDELMRAAPQLGIIGINNVNSEYSESVANCKNVYLISESSNCEDCSYCHWIQKTLFCLDCGYLHECEQCYEVLDSFNCYDLKYSQNCSNCSSSVFLDNCRSCTNCAFCTNLRHKEYCLFNEQLSKEEFQRAIAEIDLQTVAGVKQARERFEKFLAEQPRRNLQIENTENCSGDYVRNAKNCHQVYHCYDAEDCAYGEHVWRGAKDCMDANTAGRNAELVYESTNSGLDSYNVRFCRYCWGCSNTEYSNQCKNGDHLFGCVSLKPNASYCILNKQYSQEEHQRLVKRIKDHMRETREYGEFFPLSISLFGYNNTVSFDDYPMTKDEVLAKGWKWELQSTATYGGATVSRRQIPKDVSLIPESFCQEVLECVDCARNFKIVKHELAFYQKHRIPVPHSCPGCRQTARLLRRSSKEIKQVSCSECGEVTDTTLDIAKYPQIVCESCYQNLVY